MPIFRGLSKVVNRYYGQIPISKTYVGETVVWQNKPNFGLERAANQAYRIMFLGSSTTQGYLIERNEGYVNNMLGAFMTAQPMVDSSSLVHQNSGTSISPSQPGFHFLNAGLGGTTSANYYGSARATLANGFKPTLVLHMIGSNDYQQQMAISTYKNNLNNTIADIDAKVGGSQNVQHVLIQSYRRTDRADTGITWAQYGQAQSEVAASRSNVFYVNTVPSFEAYGWSDKDMMADKIHTTVAGYQLLARFVAQGMGLNDREGETIWALDASELLFSDGAIASNFPPTADSMQQKNVTGSGAARPAFRDLAAGKWLQFDGVNDYMDIVGGFTGGHGMPITFYVVLESLGGTAGSESQPFFSRSVSGDNGWWWVWREKGAHVVKSALNSASGSSTHIDTMANNQRGIIAVTMFPNSRGRMYVNSTFSAPIDAVTVDANLGPWMKSLRLGSNSGLNNFSPMDVREIRFEHGGWDVEHVRSRINQLAAKHNVTSVVKAEPKANVRVWMPFNTSLTQQAGALTPSVTTTGTPQTRDRHVYFPPSAKYRLTYSDTWSEGFTVAMWINQTDTQSGWTTLFHRTNNTGTVVNEMYISHNLLSNNPRINTGLKLGGAVREVQSSAQFPTRQWGHLAVVYRRLTNRANFNVRIYLDGREIGNSDLTGYSTTGLFDNSEPMNIAGSRDAGVWGGNMDDFMAWNRPLSQSEVNALIYGKDDPPLP